MEQLLADLDSPAVHDLSTVNLETLPAPDRREIDIPTPDSPQEIDSIPTPDSREIDSIATQDSHQDVDSSPAPDSREINSTAGPDSQRDIDSIPAPDSREIDPIASLDSQRDTDTVLPSNVEEVVSDSLGTQGTLDSVLRSVREMEDTNTLTSGEDTLRQVLQDVANLPDLSDTEPPPFSHIDERFITHRKKPRRKRAQPNGSDSDLTISTPSESLSSSSSSSLDDLVHYNQELLASGDIDDDLKPDRDMMREYMTTMSLVLEEEYSDADDKARADISPARGSPMDQDMNRTLQAEGEGEDANDTLNTNASSVYLTPEQSMEGRRASAEEFKDAHSSFTEGDGAQSGKSRISAATAPVVKESKSVSKAADSKLKKAADIKAGQAPTKAPRKLPPVPRPKASKLPAQSSKKPVTVPSSKAPSVSKGSTVVSKLPVSKGSASATSHSNRPSASNSASNSRPPPRSSSSGSSRPQSSSAPSSDSSRSSSLFRPLPRPGTAKRVTSSEERSSSSSGPAKSAAAAPVPASRGKNKSSNNAVSGKGDAGKGKTVIPVDRKSLWSDSSNDHQASDSESTRKKKIPVDSSARVLPVPHKSNAISDIEDIPFADESELDEKFSTPATSVKAKPAPRSPPGGRDFVKKRILPSPPSPEVPTATQITRIKQAQKDKAKQMAVHKPWPKADGEAAKGSGFVNPAYGSVAAALKRRPGVRLHDDPRDRRSSSRDTSTPDVLSDSDDHVPTGNTPAASTDPASSSSSSSKKKSKSATASAAKVKMRKSKEFAKLRKSEEKAQGEEAAKKEKRRSLLAMLLPKSGARVGSDPDPSSDKVKAEKVGKKVKGKHKRSKSRDSVEDHLSWDIGDMKISSVFDNKEEERERRQLARPIPIAPKASVDEFSDSDESQVSVNTLLRRKDFPMEGLDERVARKLQRVAAKQQKQAEQQRLRAAQEIQRRLQEVDERQRELEDRGIAVEKALRGEGPEADVDENHLMGEWFNLVHEKNALVRYESELMVKAKELELEDRQARLQATFRECSLRPDADKESEEIEEERHLLDELLEVVEQRNALVAMLEEDRLREQEEDRELETMMVKKGFVLSPLNYSRSPSTPSSTPTNTI